MIRLRRPWTAALVVVAACGGPDVSTPRGAMRALHEAVRDGDLDRAVEFVQGTAEEKRVARAMLEFTAAAYRFHRRMVDAYGQAGWERFNDGEDISLSFAMAEESWPEQFEFEDDGEDRVLAYVPAMPNMKVPLARETAPLVREDGCWKLAWGEGRRRPKRARREVLAGPESAPGQPLRRHREGGSHPGLPRRRDGRRVPEGLGEPVAHENQGVERSDTPLDARPSDCPERLCRAPYVGYGARTNAQAWSEATRP